MEAIPLTFEAFQTLNRTRCEAAFHAVDDWPINLWMLAIAGEAGEGCNLVKKVIRGDFTLEEKRTAILHELADVITYADLAITRLGASTADVLMEKFDIVSARHGWAPPAPSEAELRRQARARARRDHAG